MVEAHGDIALAELYRSRAEAVRGLLNLNLSYSRAKDAKELYENTIAEIDKAIERHLQARPQ